MTRGVLLIACALALVACDARPEEASEASDTASGGPFLDLLRLIPDEPRYRTFVLMGDIDAALEARGIERPPGAYDDETVAEFVEALSEEHADGFPAVVVSFFGMKAPDLLVRLSAVSQQSVGISVLDAGQWLEAGEPPEPLVAMRGAFDLDGFAARLAACGECAPAEVTEHRGWPVYAWGEETGQNLGRRFEPPFFDHLGRGGRFAVAEHVIARTPSTEAIHAVIDAYEGDGSLADDEAFRLAIETLEEAGVFALVASDLAWSAESPDGSPVPGAAARDVAPGEVLLVPYEVVAIGDGWDGGGYSTVVLVHASERAARENARRFAGRIEATRQPVNLAMLVEDLEVTVDGRVLSARIRGDGVSRFELFYTSLLAHE